MCAPDKHAPLSEADISSASLPVILEESLARLPPDARMLDWGCGRGRTVLRLRDAGWAAWGVDVDTHVLSRAEPALARRGLAEAGILRRLAEAGSFPDGFFDLVFSEETIEHIGPLDDMAATAYRLTAEGGLGLHSFPGCRRWLEPHVRIPFAHWISRGGARNAWLRTLLALGFGPRPAWPETLSEQGLPLPRPRQADVYARYLEEKVHYRPIRDIAAAFRTAGFEVSCRHLFPPPSWTRMMPDEWVSNGFPEGNILLLLRKPTTKGQPR